MPKLRWLERSVQKTTASVGPVAQRLVRDVVIGSYLAGTAILSGIARRLCPEKRGFEAVSGLLALLQVEAPRRAARLARTAPIDGEVPTFALYRIWLSVALLLAGRSRRR